MTRVVENIYVLISLLYILLIITEKCAGNVPFGSLTNKPDLLSTLLQGVLENIPAAQNRQPLPGPLRDQRHPLKHNQETFSPEAFVRYKDELLNYVLHEVHVLS